MARRVSETRVSLIYDLLQFYFFHAILCQTIFNYEKNNFEFIHYIFKDKLMPILCNGLYSIIGCLAGSPSTLASKYVSCVHRRKKIVSVSNNYILHQFLWW